ncbi:zinc ribbon domain-containing protein [Candidatus Poribacteria bacterium]|nr:zinc ribbon domain-containing protein [Candidatus Poribacteria bacterium]
MKNQNCICCGMPLRTKEDYPDGDESKNYCKYCARPNGSMKSFDEAVVGMAGFLESTQGLTGETARKAAISALTKNPAWINRAQK